MKITNPITLDVARSNSYICLLAKQFDENSRFLIATLTNNGEPMIIPAGAAVTLRATRPDGEPVAVPGIINNDGTTTVEIDDYILEVVGSASLSIEVAIGDEILTSASFNLTIQRADGNGWLRVYVAAASLAAGNYYITIGDTPYAFTTTQTIPAGGAIYFNSEGGTAQTRDASGNVLDASLTLTAGTSGTELTSDVPTMSFLTAIAGRMATIEAEMSQKANIDGSYPLLNAGSADNLMADTGATQAIPFIQEGTGKGNGEATVKAGGVLQLKKKLGNTVCVNQQIKHPHFDATTDWTNLDSVSGGVGTSVSLGKYASIRQDVSPVVGHKYYISATATADSTRNLRLCFFNSGTAKEGITFEVTQGVYKRVEDIVTLTEEANRFALANWSDGNAVVSVKEIICIDLTLWYGGNDRVPSDLLSHPENWGRYYAGSLAYNAGTLDSADGSILTSIGRNCWDGEWESGSINSTTGANEGGASAWRTVNYIPVSPNAQYYFHYTSQQNLKGRFYDAAKNYIGFKDGNGNNLFSNRAILIPPNAHFVRFCPADSEVPGHTITVSRYYSGESGYDSDYPYSVLAEVDTGSEVLRSAGAVADEKTPDGTITRNCGTTTIDLTALSYTQEVSPNTMWYSTTKPFESICKLPSDNNHKVNAHCDKLAVYMYYDLNSNVGIAVTSTGRVAISDAVKSALSSYGTVTFYYELATPTTEQGTPFAENIPCDDFGSLMWTQTKGIPQGNEIFYPTDLKGALESIVAALPSANGTYTLPATVTTAGVTFSWS